MRRPAERDVYAACDCESGCGECHQTTEVYVRTEDGHLCDRCDEFTASDVYTEAYATVCERCECEIWAEEEREVAA